jgi:NAD(P)-dependent dehydrogenase (short-subunit alcohol dehydrogenase family)
VTDEVAVAAAMEEVAGRVGTVAVLVNAAGAPPVTRPPDELTWEAWRRPIDVDVRGVFTTVRAAAPLLADGATVVNLAAGAVVAGTPLHTSFSPGQAALLSLSRCLGAWLAPRGVATHCLSPSLTLEGGIGRTAAAAFGAQEGMSAEAWIARRFGGSMLTAAEAGDAVVALTGEREGGDWVVGPFGLHRWSPLEAPAVTGWSPVATA